MDEPTKELKIQKNPKKPKPKKKDNEKELKVETSQETKTDSNLTKKDDNTEKVETSTKKTKPKPKPKKKDNSAPKEEKVETSQETKTDSDLTTSEKKVKTKKYPKKKKDDSTPKVETSKPETQQEVEKTENVQMDVSSIVSGLVSDLDSLKEQQRKEKLKQKNKLRKEKKKEFKKENKTKDIKEMESSNNNKKKYGAFSKLEYEKEQTEEIKKPKISDLTQGQSSLAEKLIKSLCDETYECMICSFAIKKNAATWNCNCCSVVFHLFCVKKWFKENQTSEVGILVCPQCRNETKGMPNKYTCFCGQTKDPDYSDYLTPHSCGNVCGKKREGTQCPHTCTVLCHPGSCPECPANRKIECFCGKKDFVIRCSDKVDSKSCGEICGKKLNCGKHTCDSICHEGDCQPCPITSKQKCYCGKEEGIKPCLNTVTQKENGENRTFSCKKVCGKKLKCGNHTCELPCHSGACHTCHYSISNVKTCPCGKSKLEKERKSCLDAIPTCDNPCKKKLPCGIHSCSKKCHVDDCGHCMELIGMSCRCGSTFSKIPCALTYLDPSDPFVEQLKEEYKIQFPILCDKVCNTTKNCVRHKCKTVCCPSKHAEFDIQGNHICHQTCGRKLNCGKHSCDLPCHGLNCQPCAHIIRHRLVCKCGKTHIDPPQHCGVKLPPCENPCSIQRKCGHAVKHNCHEKGDCPPCVELIDKECSGQHQLVKVPCCATQISCGNSCDKPLNCGMHKCNRVCHNGECIGSGVNLKEKGCGQNCDKVLPCKHLCNEKCHPLKLECETDCQQKVKITCECKHMSEIIDCGTAKNLVESRYPELKYSASGYPPLIDCNSECRLLARNKKLAEAFNIDLVKHDLPAYSKFITNMAKRNPKFLDEVEEIFSNFLKDKTNAKYYFAPMSSEKRSFIFELSQFYNFEYSSVDKKPYKSAVIVKTQKSKLPAIRLSVVMKDSSKIKILEEKLEKLELEEEKRNAHQPNSYYKKPSKEVFDDEEWNQDATVDGVIDEIVIAPKPLPKLSKTVKSENMWANLEEE